MLVSLRIAFFILLTSISATFLCAKEEGASKERKSKKINYPLLDDPIDVVFVCHPKDKNTLEYAIKGIKKNCANLRRVIVVSPEKITDNAEWVDEKIFPFSKEEIALTIARGSKKKAEAFFKASHRTPGWYYQQQLKFYSPFVVPDISSNVLIVDADTIFMNPVTFINESNGGLFCYNKEDKPKQPYFDHAKRLVPGYKRMYPQYYSVCHHMLLQKPILEDLFSRVEKYHKKPFWKAFCECVDLSANKGASEYEIYYSFALSHAKQVKLRPLKWTNSSKIEMRNEFKRQGYHFVAFHDYLREGPFTTQKYEKTHPTPKKSKKDESPEI